MWRMWISTLFRRKDIIVILVLVKWYLFSFILYYFISEPWTIYMFYCRTNVECCDLTETCSESMRVSQHSSVQRRKDESQVEFYSHKLNSFLIS